LRSCDPEKLTELNLGNNDFDEQDLTCFSRFTKLEKLYLGSGNTAVRQKNVYNKFYGSLEPLKDLTKLKKLDISNTDIDSGLEHLYSVERLYCFNCRGEKAGCENVQEELKKHFKEGGQYYDL